MADNFIPPIPQAAPVQKSSSGCLPFFMGCLTGLFFSLLLVATLAFGAFYMAQKFIDRQVPQIYENIARPYLLENFPGTETQKQDFLSDLDELVHQYPAMTLEQKKEAFQKLAAKWEGVLNEVAPGGPRTKKNRPRPTEENTD